MNSPNVTTPAELARDAFKQLAARRIPPTPENYARVYAERAGRPLAEVQPAIGAVEAMLTELRFDPARAGLAKELAAALEGSDWKAVRTVLKAAISRPAKSEDGAGAQPATTGSQRVAAAGATAAQRTAAAASPDTGPQRLAAQAAPGATQRPGAATGPGSTQRFEVAAGGQTATQRVAIAAETDAFTQTLKGLVGKIITYCVDADLGYSDKVVEEAAELGRSIQKVSTADELQAAASRLRHFWVDLELRREGPQHLMRSLQGLLHLLIQNLGDLVADDRWVHGQVEQIKALLAAPLTPEVIDQAERTFKDYLIRQGTLKHSLDEARSALREMMATLVARLADVTSNTGEYTGKLTQYSARIRSARDLSDISEALGNLLTDTQSMHSDMSRTHGELQDTQARVTAHEERVRELEAQLSAMSQRLGEDPLTRALNRRGLDQQYSVEEARTRRKNTPLCVAVLDVDNFKQINDEHGHAVGDDALRHLVEVVRQVIRPTDSLARYGGEEFVILLPETNLENAERAMVRVQRELTKRFFLHNNERVLITFSAGVAERRADETQLQLIERADAAMFHAKRAGKNRVQRAD